MFQHKFGSSPLENENGARRIRIGVFGLYFVAATSLVGAAVNLLALSIVPALASLFWVWLSIWGSQKLLDGSNSARKGVLILMIFGMLGSAILMFSSSDISSWNELITTAIGLVIGLACLRVFIAMWGNDDLREELAARENSLEAGR